MMWVRFLLPLPNQTKENKTMSIDKANTEMNEIRELIYNIRKERGIRFNLVHFLDGTVDLVRKGEFVFNPDYETVTPQIGWDQISKSAGGNMTEEEWKSANTGATSLNQVREYLKDILLEENK